MMVALSAGSRDFKVLRVLKDFKVFKVPKVSKVSKVSKVLLVPAVLAAQGRHALRKAAVLGKVRSKSLQLSVQQIVGLI